jgi:hypothetical protein
MLRGTTCAAPNGRVGAAVARRASRTEKKGTGTFTIEIPSVPTLIPPTWVALPSIRHIAVAEEASVMDGEKWVTTSCEYDQARRR